MSGDVPAGRPLPARRFSDEEIARILKAAADLQAREAEATGAPARGLTLQELRDIAAEAGIDPRFVDRAAAGSVTATTGPGAALVGGPWSWEVHRTVDGEVAEEDRDRIVQAIRRVLRQKGEVEDVYGRMEWSYNDGLGPVMVGVTSRDGSTEVEVSAQRSGEVGLYYGVGVPMGGIVLGAVIAATVGVSGPPVVAIVLLAMILVFLGLRVTWGALSRRWGERVDRLAADVSQAVSEVALLPPAESGRAGEDELDGERS